MWYLEGSLIARLTGVVMISGRGVDAVASICFSYYSNVDLEKKGTAGTVLQRSFADPTCRFRGF